MQIQAVERWLDEGWTPWRIAWVTVGLVVTAVPVYGYVSHPHHPGAVWWLLGAACVITVWTSSEAVRWRVKYKRLLASTKALKAAKPTSKHADPLWTLITAQAQKKEETAKKLRSLIVDGRVLQSKIKTASHDQIYVPASVAPEVIRWEGDVAEALARYPKEAATFENQVAVLHNIGGPGDIFPDMANLIIEDALKLLGDTAKLISQSTQMV